MEETARLYRAVFDWDYTVDELLREGGHVAKEGRLAAWRRSLRRLLSGARRESSA
jgi:hypothetical protein